MDGLERFAIDWNDKYAKGKNGYLGGEDYLAYLKQHDRDAYSFAKYQSKLFDGKGMYCEKNNGNACETEPEGIKTDHEGESSVKYLIKFKGEDLIKNYTKAILVSENFDEDPKIFAQYVYKNESSKVGFPLYPGLKPDLKEGVLTKELYLGWQLVPVPGGEDYQAIVDDMNQFFDPTAEDKIGCMQIFRNELGWLLDIEFDKQTGLSMREDNERKNDPENDYANGQKNSQNNGQISGQRRSDILGEYLYNTADNEKNKIIIYCLAIEEFLKRKTDPSKVKDWNLLLSNAIKYVIAHELFHAHQDFKIDFMEFDRTSTQAQKDSLETEAENFAFMFIEQCLKDNELPELIMETRQ